MDLVSFWLTLKIFSIVVVLSYVISTWLKKRGNLSSFHRIPSPPSLPLIGHAHLFLGSNGENPLNTTLNIVKNYDESGIVHIDLLNEKIVIIFKPEYFQIFFTMNSMAKACFYRPLGDVVNPSSFLADGKVWKDMRKSLLMNFFGTPMDVFFQNFQRVSERLVEDLREKADGQPFAFHDYAFFTTAASICYNVGHDTKIDEMKHYFTSYMPLMFKLAFDRNLKPLYYFTPIFKLTKKGREFHRLVKDFYNTLDQYFVMYKERLNEMVKNGEAVPELYAYRMLKNTSDEVKFEVISEVITLLAAGSDTTGNTLGFLFMVLGLFPEIQDKILEEDRQILSNLQGRKETVEDLRNYTYLECVIKETMRLFPIGPFIGRKLQEDTKFGDYVIPEGTNVLLFQMYVNHDPKIFPEPFTFKPERFFKENLSSIPPYAYNPFSAGPRNCPGKHYGMISMKTVTIAVLRQYRVLSVYKNLEEAISNAEIAMTLCDKNHYPIKLVPRA